MKRMRKSATLVLAALILATISPMAAEIPDPLPDPDGKPADMTKKVKVFILLGQSNMVGAGSPGSLQNATKKGLYPYLVDEAGSWTVRKDVRNVFVMCSGGGPWKSYKNEWMTISGNIGPEMGIGHYVGHVLDEPVLILKSCIGNRSLGYDLLPPGADGYEGNPEAPRKPKSAKGWYAGVQYDGDVRTALDALADLGTYYPDAKGYEVAGFCFFQGAKDCGSQGLSDAYEKNLVAFIKALRKDFNAPDAPFVCATMGETKKGSGGNKGTVLNAQLAVDGATGTYPEFKGNVKTFYTHPVSKGGHANGHYSGNAETYMNVGEGMGRLMAEMLVAGGRGKKRSVGGAAEPGELRTWTSSEGTKVEARFIGMKYGSVLLKKEDGSAFKINPRSLCREDQVYLKTR